ncbi:MAG TPA: S1C family serine protease [Pseudonocardia sp.]|jgi:S1-C subfamily serine protease|nr:S1C family serine protease [Pseudonocardia sp.]
MVTPAPADGRAEIGGLRPAAVVERTTELAGDELRRSVSPALVTVVAQLRSQNATGVGTGIVLSSDGEVLTNYHVIAGGSALRVTDVGNGETYSASVVGVDRQHDVAVLRLRGASGLRVAKLGNSATVRPGTQVAAIGDADGPGEQLSVVTGSVTGLGRAVQTRRDELTGKTERLSGLIEVAADVREGFSGGPVVDGAGRVLGVTVAATVEAGGDDPGGSGFAIPISTALAAAHRISSAHPQSRPGALAGRR